MWRSERKTGSFASLFSSVHDLNARQRTDRSDTIYSDIQGTISIILIQVLQAVTEKTSDRTVNMESSATKVFVRLIFLRVGENFVDTMKNQVLSNVFF